jgi:hypothetical protein
MDGQGDAEFDTFGVEGEVGGVGGGPSNHERPQAQSSEAVLNHPPLEFIDSCAADHDVRAGEGDEPVGIPGREGGHRSVVHESDTAR